MSPDTHPRPHRPLAAPWLQFSLADKIEQLRQEPEWKAAGHNAITLVKEAGLGVVLIALGKGHRLDHHTAPGFISVHVLTGRVQFRIGDDEITLGPGELVTMVPKTVHALLGVEESTVLLTIARGSGATS